MTGDYPLGADNDTDAIREWRNRSFPDMLRDLGIELPEPITLRRWLIGDDFPATPAGIVAGSDRSGLPATPKPHH
jgi:hypothetical protein